MIEKVGLEFVAKNAESFTRATENANRAASNFQDTLKDVNGGGLDRLLNLTKRLQTDGVNNADKFAASMQGVADILSGTGAGGLGGAVNGAASGLQGLASGFAALPPQVALAAGAVGAATVALTGFVALGTRGAAFEGIITSFESLTGESVKASETLNSLRAAADGTVDDIRLLSLTNFALAGSTGEFRKEFQAALPQLLEAARAAGQLRGIDPAQAFNDLVEGIKKAEPEIIDNLGITLKLGEAYKAFAQQLGVSEDALTAEQRSQAVLAATLAGTGGLISGVGGVIETTSTKLQRLSVTFTNLFNRLAIAVQPAFKPFLDALQLAADIALAVLEPALRLVEAAFVGLGFVLNTVVAPLRLVFDTLQASVGAVTGFIGDRLAAIGAQFQAFGEAVLIILTPFGQILSNLVVVPLQQLGALVGLFFNKLGLGIDTSVGNFARGAASIIGALAAGIVTGGAIVIRVVAALAKSIADFLIGQSPPPKGALSKIDDGGANVMQAWLDGFASVALTPVEQIAADVNQTLGSIATLGIEEVEQRLGQLDKAIQPFQDQLKIAQARLEAIKAPAEAAIDAINRQFDRLAPALEAGNEAAAAQIRQLDTLRAKFNASVDAQQKQADLAAIQLAFAQSQQSEERTLLEIQKARLAVLNQGAKTAERVASAPRVAEETAAKKPTGGKAETPQAAGLTGFAAASTTALPQGVAGANELVGLILDPIQGSLEEFNGEVDNLETQGGRLAEGISGFPDRIATAFDGVAEQARLKLQPLFDYFTDSRTEGTLAFAIFNFPNRLGIWISGIYVKFTTFVTDSLASMAGLVGFFTDPEQEGGLLNAVSRFFGEGGGLSTLLSSGTTLFTNFVTALFGEGGVFAGVGAALNAAIVTPIVGVFNVVVDTINGLIGRVEDLINRILAFSASIKRATGIDSGLPETIAFGRIERIAAPVIGAGGGGGGGGASTTNNTTVNINSPTPSVTLSQAIALTRR